MRIWLVVVIATLSCGKDPDPASKQNTATTVVGSGSSTAADAATAALPPATLDDSITIVDDDPCTTDCTARCAAKLLSACIHDAELQAKSAGEDGFEARCNAGQAIACTNMRYVVAPADAEKWAAKEKAAQANLEAACHAGDAWSCWYAIAGGPGKRPALWEAACSLGLFRLCVPAARDAPDRASKVRRMASMFGRACKERSNAKLCKEGADAAASLGDASAAAMLRQRGEAIEHGER